MKNLKAKAQKGYSLVELSISLAVIAIILVGGLAGVQRILRNNSENNMVRSTQSALAAILTQLMRQPDFTDATTQNLSGLGIWGRERLTSSGSTTARISHEMGGTIHINPVSSVLGSYGPNQSFRYTLGNIPAGSCASLVQGLDMLAYAISVKKWDPQNPPATTGSVAFTTTAGEIVKAAGSASVNLANLANQCRPSGNDTKQIDLYLVAL